MFAGVDEPQSLMITIGSGKSMSDSVNGAGEGKIVTRYTHSADGLPKILPAIT